MCFETYRKCRGNDLYWDSLSDIYRPANLRVFKAPKVRPWWSSFLQKQAPTGSLKNNCLKQQLKPSTKSCMLWKGLLHGFLLHNKPRKTKIKTSKGKITFLQCRCRFQWRCWCRCFQMVLRNYSDYKSPGTGNWVWALFLEYS